MVPRSDIVMVLLMSILISVAREWTPADALSMFVDHWSFKQRGGQPFNDTHSSGMSDRLFPM